MIQDLQPALTALQTREGVPERLPPLALAAAAAAAGRRETQREVLRLALELQTPVEDLREVLLQTYLFAGYPRAINALADLAALRPLDPLPPAALDADLGRERNWLARGESLCRRVYGERYPKLLETIHRISPEVGRWMIQEGYGKVLGRDELPVWTRELCAVAALTVLEVPDQLRAHLRGCYLVGANRIEIEAAIDAAGLVAPDTAASAHLALDRTAAAFEAESD